MDGIRNHYMIKQNRPGSKSQNNNVFSHMHNLDLKAGDMKLKKGGDAS